MRTKVLFVALAFASACFAKDIKTVVLTTNPQMHCNNCEKKIKENIRFEKHHQRLREDQIRGQRGERKSQEGGCNNIRHKSIKINHGLPWLLRTSRSIRSRPSQSYQ